MASVYILYSAVADSYYVGFTKDMEQRLAYHREKEFENSFTTRYRDWELYIEISGLTVESALRIEGHIKRMKSRVYIANLKKYPEMVLKLRRQYS